MEIIEEIIRDVTVFSLQGRLDANTSNLLETALMSKINDGGLKFVIDFASLVYISSAGLRVLLLGAKRLRGAGGSLTLSSLKPEIKEVFDIAGFSSIFPFYTSKDEALKEL